MDHVSFVGEANVRVGGVFVLLKRAFDLARNRFSSLSMEVQPLDQSDYEQLLDSGLSSVLVYQETYNRQAYAKYHLKGMKWDFDYR